MSSPASNTITNNATFKAGNRRAISTDITPRLNSRVPITIMIKMVQSINSPLPYEVNKKAPMTGMAKGA
jgi:hypothetical protein